MASMLIHTARRSRSRKLKKHRYGIFFAVMFVLAGVLGWQVSRLIKYENSPDKVAAREGAVVAQPVEEKSDP